MNIPIGVSAMLQVIAALLIFIASYLALVLCTIACLAVAELFSERAAIVQQYGAKATPVGASAFSKMDSVARKSSLTFPREIPKGI
jgi:hypothetical protein